MNSDLQRERSQATFDPQRITYMLDGGRDKTERRRYLEELILRDPTGIFDNSTNLYLHRTERHVRALAKHVRLIELCRSIGIGNKYDGQIIQDPDFVTLLGGLADDLPTALHWIMFVPNIVSLCNEQQQKEWLPLVRDWKMIGCYAQTELGHGSNVRALETTATFVNDGKDGHFIINSPTITAAKFWPGTLGRTANHAMVIARLIDGDNIDRGIHNFLVPLRSMTDHTLLEGVETGDIGPKIGYNVMDNGYAIFNNVKIPRRYMAMKFATVDTNGKYSVKHTTDAASKIAYITMMQVRAYIVNEAGKNLAMACCIVIRYSAVRRQGYTSEGSSSDGDKPTELQILDYKQQQYRILPLLAASYCFYFTGKQLLQRLKYIENSLLLTNQQGGKNSLVTKEDVTDIHASSSALKSYTTMVTADGIEECRKACGGHGFLACSGLPELYTTYLQNPTVEGDNHMLPQQVLKVLLKLVQTVVENDTATLEEKYKNCTSYSLIPSIQSILKQKISSSRKGSVCSVQKLDDWYEIDTALVPAFRHRAARLLVEVAEQLRTNTEQNDMSFEQAWNYSLIAMSRCSRAYSQYLLVLNFTKGIQEEEAAAQGANLGSAEVSVLQDLVRLIGCYWIEQELGDYLEDGYVTQAQAVLVRSAVIYLLDTIRPNAVALVDARDFSDFRLKNSALGRYDGNVYPAILDAARRDPLNQHNPGVGYKEHLHRLIVQGVGKYNNTNNTNGISGTASDYKIMENDDWVKKIEKKKIFFDVGEKFV